MIFDQFEEAFMGGSNLLCGECIRPIPDCAWMSKGKPVKGWTAEKTVIRMDKRPVDSYHITACPLFVPHPKSEYFDKEGNRV